MSKLISIRDKVFFPDYDLFDYIPQENLYNNRGEYFTLIIGLISVSANRLLSLHFNFSLSKSTTDGVSTDTMYILNEDLAGTKSINIKVLAKKNGINLPDDYLKLTAYSGTFAEKSLKCLTKIKQQYDTFARNIISGEQWDYSAWKDPRDDYC